MKSSKENRWAGHVARMGKSRGTYKVLVGKLEGNLDGRIILKLILEKGVKGTDWIYVAQDRDNWRTLVIFLN